MIKQTRFWLYMLVAAFASLWTLQARAQSYPDKPVHIIVGVAPGGGTDLTARVLAQHLSKLWGEPVVVENRLGAAGAGAAELVVKSPADGYTLLVASDSLTALSAFRSDVPYDLRHDLLPVSLIGEIPLALAVKPSLPVYNMKQLIALAKSEPGTLTYGSAGVGSMAHLQTARLASTAGINILHVPYKGLAAGVIGVADGEIDMSFGIVANVQSLAAAGKVRMLAVSTAQRSPLAPSVPTISEAALPGYAFTSWMGVFAPAGLPKDVLTALNTSINQAVNSPDMKAALVKQSGEAEADSPAQFTKFVNGDLAEKVNIVQTTGMKTQ